MRKTHCVVSGILASLLLVGCSTGSNSTAPTSGASSADGDSTIPGTKLVYGQDDTSRQYGNFFEAQNVSGDQKVPLVVFIHGGGWTEKSTADSANTNAQDLVNHGVSVWNIEYRGITHDGVQGDGGWPMTYQDVAAAIDYIPELAKQAKTPIDLEKVTVAGYSAGGNLSTWTCARTALPAGSVGANPAFPINNCVGIAGVYDLALAYNQHDHFVRTLLGGTPQEVPERYANSSPAENINPNATFHVLHGKNDQTVNVDEVTAFVDHAKAKGLKIDATIVDDAPHISWADEEDPQWDQAKKTILQQVGITL